MCPSSEALHSHIAICPKRLARFARRGVGRNVEKLYETQKQPYSLPRRFLKARNVRLPRCAGHLKSGPLSNYFCNDLAYRIASYACSAANRVAHQKSRNRRFESNQRRRADTRLILNDKEKQ